MASKRTGRKFLSDNVVNARRNATPRPQRVTIITGGMKYRPGQPPVPVYPAGAARVLGRGVVARSSPLPPVVSSPPADAPLQAE